MFYSVLVNEFKRGSRSVLWPAGSVHVLLYRQVRDQHMRLCDAEEFIAEKESEKQAVRLKRCSM